MKTKLVTFAIALLMATPVLAQDVQPATYYNGNNELSVERQIRLKDHNQEETITIDIDKKVSVFMLRVQTKVGEGKLTIEIYDPNKNREGMFSVGTQLSSTIDEMATGQINKEFHEPQEGTWTIKIKPEKAYGDIMISSQTSYN